MILSLGRVDTTLCECLVPFPIQMKDKLVETTITVQKLSENKAQTLFLTDQDKMIDLPSVSVVRMATYMAQYVIWVDMPPPNDKNDAEKLCYEGL